MYKYNVLKLKTACHIPKDRNLNKIKNENVLWQRARHESRDGKVKNYQFGRKWAHLNLDKYKDITDSI